MHRLKISPPKVSITFQGEPRFLRWPSLLKLNITSQGGRMTKVIHGWTVTTQSPRGRRMTKVAYKQMVTILSYLWVDAWPKSPMGGRSLHQVTQEQMYEQSRLWVDGHYTKSPMGGRITKSPLWVDGHYTKSFIDGRMTSCLQVDGHHTKSPTSRQPKR